MSQDYEVTRKIWDGKVPVEFALDSTEYVTQSLKPYYTMLSRVSYFPLVLSKLLQYFVNMVDEIKAADVWFEYNGAPLKWHYPVGVLFDLHKIDDTLPWRITVRTKAFPDQLIRMANRDALESSFIQSIKEADQLKHKAAVINAMKSDEHKQLWDGLVHDRFDEFWSVNKKLMVHNSNGMTDESVILHVPMRFYQVGHPFRQALITPYSTTSNDTSNRPTTLADAIRKLRPDFDASKFRIVSHGIELPLDTPNIWLAENLAYPDNFVHLCLVER